MDRVALFLQFFIGYVGSPRCYESKNHGSHRDVTDISNGGNPVGPRCNPPQESGHDCASGVYITPTTMIAYYGKLSAGGQSSGAKDFRVRCCWTTLSLIREAGIPGIPFG